VTKKDIVRAIAEELALSHIEAGQIVQKTFDAIVNTLVTEQRVELRNFGVFEVKWRKSRKARNPRTGEKVMVPERCVVVFKPGQLVQHQVNEEIKAVATPVE
jgi:integration host factor subunit beta